MNLVKFKSEELESRNYKEGDKVFVEFAIKNVNSRDEIWLYSAENDSNLWLSNKEAVLFGKPVMFKDGDLVIYDNKIGKAIECFDGSWIVLRPDNTTVVMYEPLLTSIVKEENVL